MTSARRRSTPSADAPPPRALTVAGVMSGTSADGVDVAFCRISPPLRAGGSLRLKVLGHRAFPYAAELRSAVLAAMDAKQTSVAELARLNWRLGETYADCVASAAADMQLQPALIACHGQTIYHQGAPAEYLGRQTRATWQLGEASVLAERLRCPVITDFRPADLAAGGQGAPLVPMLDFTLFQHATKSRLLLNLGGIANVTALPAGRGAQDVLAFDIGPANMVIDALMQTLYGQAFDADGAAAASGKILQPVLDTFSRCTFLTLAPPKSCGREDYGADFAARFLAACRQTSKRKQDAIATATAFTVQSILEAYRCFCWPHLGQRAPLARATEMFVAGGGVRNTTLIEGLRTGFAAFGVTVRPMEAAGLSSAAKEAAAFALLGWLTFHRLPGNIPNATGAGRAVVLGKVTHGS